MTRRRTVAGDLAAMQRCQRKIARRQAARPTIPCGWCDRPVPVDADDGQVVYCSDDHERADTYVPGADD